MNSGLVAILTSNDTVGTAIFAEHFAQAFGNILRSFPAREVASLFVELLEDDWALQQSARLLTIVMTMKVLLMEVLSLQV